MCKNNKLKYDNQEEEDVWRIFTTDLRRRRLIRMLNRDLLTMSGNFLNVTELPSFWFLFYLPTGPDKPGGWLSFPSSSEGHEGKAPARDGN
jgi:hypothetical protein